MGPAAYCNRSLKWLPRGSVLWQRDPFTLTFPYSAVSPMPQDPFCSRFFRLTHKASKITIYPSYLLPVIDQSWFPKTHLISVGNLSLLCLNVSQGKSEIITKMASLHFAFFLQFRSICIHNELLDSCSAAGIRWDNSDGSALTFNSFQLGGTL